MTPITVSALCGGATKSSVMNAVFIPTPNSVPTNDWPFREWVFPGPDDMGRSGHRLLPCVSYPHWCPLSPNLRQQRWVVDSHGRRLCINITYIRSSDAAQSHQVGSLVDSRFLLPLWRGAISTISDAVVYYFKLSCEGCLHRFSPGAIQCPLIPSP